MPIHDFKCRGCGTRFEQLVKVDESPDCPACGAAGAERLFSATAAVSTGRTRARAIASARRKASAVKQEKDHAHAVYMREHLRDHGGGE
jgi:putative FmdB family regulatory protein